MHRLDPSTARTPRCTCNGPSRTRTSTAETDRRAGPAEGTTSRRPHPASLAFWRPARDEAEERASPRPSPLLSRPLLRPRPLYRSQEAVWTSHEQSSQPRRHRRPSPYPRHPLGPGGREVSASPPSPPADQAGQGRRARPMGPRTRHLRCSPRVHRAPLPQARPHLRRFPSICPAKALGRHSLPSRPPLPSHRRHRALQDRQSPLAASRPHLDGSPRVPRLTTSFARLNDPSWTGLRRASRHCLSLLSSPRTERSSRWRGSSQLVRRRPQKARAGSGHRPRRARRST